MAGDPKQPFDADEEPTISGSNLAARREHATSSWTENEHRSAAGPPPETIAGYRIVDKLGEGGMGVVWEAEQERPKRRVALKVMRRDHQVDDMHARMFRREAETLARLKHPNIAAIYESGHTEDGHDYFAMELVRGQTLDQWVNDRPRAIDADELELRLRLFCTVCDAVHYAHQRGVIHRDLKPSNIIVGEEETSSSTGASGAGRPAVKILDFGLARVTDSDIAATMISEIGVIKGTLQYMSPEQARGDIEAIDVRTDVYALGVILFELLAGKRPYDVSRASLIEAVRVVCEEAPTPLRQSWTGVRKLDPDLETIVGKTLEKDVDRRYGSAAAVSEDVLRFLQSQPILARPPSAAYQLRKMVSRNKLAVAFAASVMLLLVAFAVAMAGLSVRLARERDRANQEAEVSRQVSDFMVDAFRVSDPGEARGNTVTAREILDNGAAQIEEAFVDQPEVQARLMSTIGVVYQSLGLYSAAEKPLVDALNIKQRELANDDPGVASAMRDLAHLRKKMGDLNGAEELFRKALEIFLAAHGGQHIDVANTLLNVATTVHAKGDYATAEQMYSDATAMADNLLDDDDILMTAYLNNYANLLGDTSRFEEAESLYRQCLALKRNHYGKVHPEVAFALDNLAINLFEQADYEAARPLFFEALEMLYTIYGPEHPEVAQTLGNVSAFLTTIGDTERAEEMTRQELALNLKLLGPDHFRIADSYDALAQMELLKGNHEEAEEHARQALSIYRKSLPAGNVKIANAESTLGGILTAQGRYGEAEPLLIQSFETMEQSQDKTRYRTGALERLIELYDSWGQPEKAATYRILLEQVQPETGSR